MAERHAEAEMKATMRARRRTVGRSIFDIPVSDQQKRILRQELQRLPRISQSRPEIPKFKAGPRRHFISQEKKCRLGKLS
jgi:hypothetical protein